MFLDVYFGCFSGGLRPSRVLVRCFGGVGEALSGFFSHVFQLFFRLFLEVL